MLIRQAAPFTGMVAALAVASLGLTLGATATGPDAPLTAAAAHSGQRCAQPGSYELPKGSDEVQLDPADFTTRIDHEYWPMRPGTTWRYRERGGGEVATVRVTVTHRTKLIEGIRTRVVHDVVRVDDRVTENTFDWYAQDDGGSIWYLGERTREYEAGQIVSTEGSWRHGRHGAQAGVILPARLRDGCGYREEYRADHAEDQARILSTSEAIRTPTGFHRRVLQTANTTPLQRNLLENKFYARGVGPVLELDLSPQLGRAELVKVVHRD